jgi:perosamine synthetase
MIMNNRATSKLRYHDIMAACRYQPPSGVPITLSDIAAGLVSYWKEQEVQAFADDICSYFSVKHCFLVSSGRAGLSLLLQALHRLHPEKNEVVLPAYTSFSVPSAVVHAGLQVSLYDLDAQTLSPALESLKDALSPRTLCIVVCHLYGYPCDMDAVLALAGAAGVPVIDDAAQAMGAVYRGKMVGTMGDAGLFSLSRGKNISAVDGGILVTNSEILANELKGLAFAEVPLVEHLMIIAKALILSLLLHPLLYGIPARMPFLDIGASVFNPVFPQQRLTSFQAGIGRRMLRRLAGINAARRNVARKIMEKIALPGRFPQIVAGAEPVFLRLPRICKKESPSVCPRKGIVRSYPSPLHKIPQLYARLVTQGDFPVAEELAQSTLTFPTHQFISDTDISEMQCIGNVDQN